MKILFLLFSGTNNTQEIARLLASDFSLQGHSFEIMKIDIETPLIDLDQYDLIGLGYPIYAFNEPRFFWRYVKKLKMNKRAKYFIFKTSGETLGLNNASSRRLIRHLKRQKCVLLGDYHFVMPYNIHFRFEDAFVKEIMAYNRKLSKVLVSNVLNEEKHFLNQILYIVSWLGLLVFNDRGPPSIPISTKPTCKNARNVCDAFVIVQPKILLIKMAKSNFNITVKCACAVPFSVPLMQ